MKRTLANELKNHVGARVCMRGWLNNLRILGKINFIILRDRTGLAQIVTSDKSQIAHLQPGSILRIEGTVAEGPELVDPKITVEVAVTENLPIEYYRPVIPNVLEQILVHRPLSLRNRHIQEVFQAQAIIAQAYREFMIGEGAVEYFGPNLVGASSEGGAEFFHVDYFGYPAALAQSSQLYKQMMVGVNERVFALMPFFRAELSNTTRHLTEGKQFEFEMGFFDDWSEILDVQERCMKYIVRKLGALAAVVAPENVPFPRLTFQEAQELFYQRTGIDERDEPDLSPAAERELCAWAQEKKGTDFVFITDWLQSKRPFYAYPNGELSNTHDLLCAGTEISSGGQRRHTYESMIEGIIAKGMDPEEFEDYLSIFKYGMPPHGGFGIGLERLTMTMLKLKNIREASLFPSDPKRIASVRIKAKIFFGGENIRGEIIRLLKANEMPFEHTVHEATPTSQDSARVRNQPIETGVKALILRGKSSKKNIQVNIPAHQKLDMKAVAAVAKEKFEFEDPAVIFERWGVQVGGIPPFGNLLNLETYFDEEILKQEIVNFNCGLLTESIQMKSVDLAALIQPTVDSLTQK